MNKTWAIVIAVIAVLVVGYGGYRVYNHFHRLAMQTATPVAKSMQPTSGIQPTSTASASSVIKMVPHGKLGTIITDAKGMTLYTYTKDTTGVSNCSGTCLTIWPAFTATTNATKLPVNLSVIKRSDGTLQYAWKGMPLYYFTKDVNPGDTKGQGVGGIWFVAK